MPAAQSCFAAPHAVARGRRLPVELQRPRTSPVCTCNTRCVLGQIIYIGAITAARVCWNPSRARSRGPSPDAGKREPSCRASVNGSRWFFAITPLAPCFRLVVGYKVSLLLVDAHLLVLYIMGSVYTPLTYTPMHPVSSPLA